MLSEGGTITWMGVFVTKLREVFHALCDVTKGADFQCVFSTGFQRVSAKKRPRRWTFLISGKFNNNIGTPFMLSTVCTIS